jgi:hypothetical protein
VDDPYVVQLPEPPAVEDDEADDDDVEVDEVDSVDLCRIECVAAWAMGRVLGPAAVVPDTQP